MITKSTPVWMALEWDCHGTGVHVFSPERNDPLPVCSGFDIDASAVMFAQNGAYLDAACFKQLKSKCGSMVHSGDETTGEVVGDDEQISVELDKVPLEADHILFLVSIISPSYSFKNVDISVDRMHDFTFGSL